MSELPDWAKRLAYYSGAFVAGFGLCYTLVTVFVMPLEDLKRWVGSQHKPTELVDRAFSSESEREIELKDALRKVSVEYSDTVKMLTRDYSVCDKNLSEITVQCQEQDTRISQLFTIRDFWISNCERERSKNQKLLAGNRAGFAKSDFYFQVTEWDRPWVSNPSNSQIEVNALLTYLGNESKSKIILEDLRSSKFIDGDGFTYGLSSLVFQDRALPYSESQELILTKGKPYKIKLLFVIVRKLDSEPGSKLGKVRLCCYLSEQKSWIEFDVIENLLADEKACPFLYCRTEGSEFKRIGEIIRNNEGKTSEEMDLLRIPNTVDSREGKLVVMITEEKDEVAFVEYLGLSVGGMFYEPENELLKKNDKRYLVLHRGDTLFVEFLGVPYGISDGHTFDLMSLGYYTKIDRQSDLP